MASDLTKADIERLSAYKDAVARCRWFLLITTLISCLILTHAYLQQFGFQDAQLEETLERRIDRIKIRPVSIEESKFQGLSEESLLLNKKHGVEFLVADLEEAYRRSDQILATKDVAEHLYTLIRTNNTLDELSFDHRTLPLLGLSVPTNDYLGVMTALLIVFVIGLWLNVRSVSTITALDSVAENAILLELIMLNFTFTGLWGSKKDIKIAKFIQASAFWLPFWFLLVATAINFINPTDNILNDWKQVVAGDKLYLLRSLVFSLAALGIILSVTKSMVHKVRRIDRHLENLRLNVISND